MQLPFKLCSAAMLLFCTALGARAADPQISVVLPRGVQRGAEADIQIHGTRLADAQEVMFYVPGITVTKLEPADGVIKAHVQVAKDAKLGEYPLRVRTTSGVSDLRTMFVTPFPVIPEKEP